MYVIGYRPTFATGCVSSTSKELMAGSLTSLNKTGSRAVSLPSLRKKLTAWGPQSAAVLTVTRSLSNQVPRVTYGSLRTWFRSTKGFGLRSKMAGSSHGLIRFMVHVAVLNTVPTVPVISKTYAPGG